MNLTEEMQEVVKNLEARDWIQGRIQVGESVCAHGAVQTCQGLRPGDEHIIRAVMRKRGLPEGWNDAPGRTKSEVLAVMRLIEVSDADLEATFGPAWVSVLSVVRRAAVLTPGEATRLGTAHGAARDAVWGAAQVAAHGAARDAAWGATQGATHGAAHGAVWDAVGDAAWGATRDAVWDAAAATCVADLVGQHGLTQSHIDTLMQPWTDVLGTDWENT